MTVQPEPPLSGWFLLVLLLAGAGYVFVRAFRHRQAWGLRIGAVVGAFFVLLLPSLAVGLTQDLTCRDSGVMPRPDGGLIVVCVTAVALLGLLGLLWATGDHAQGTP